MTAKKQKNEVAKHEIKKVEFAFSQGEKELSATIDSVNSLESKASRYVTIFISLLVVSIGTCFTAYFDCTSPLHRQSVKISLILFILSIFGLLYYSIEVLKVRRYFFLGSKPEDLLDNPKEDYNKLIYTEACRYNGYIEENRVENEKRAALLEVIHTRLLTAILIPLLVFILLEVLC